MAIHRGVRHSRPSTQRQKSRNRFCERLSADETAEGIENEIACTGLRRNVDQSTGQGVFVVLVWQTPALFLQPASTFSSSVSLSERREVVSVIER